MRGSGSRLGAAVLAIGLFVGAVVTASAGSNAGLCATDPESVCDGLVRTLSLRMGLVAGVATVLVLLTMAGLLRMVALDEKRRLAHRGDVSD